MADYSREVMEKCCTAYEFIKMSKNVRCEVVKQFKGMGQCEYHDFHDMLMKLGVT